MSEESQNTAQSKVAFENQFLSTEAGYCSSVVSEAIQAFGVTGGLNRNAVGSMLVSALTAGGSITFSIDGSNNSGLYWQDIVTSSALTAFGYVQGLVSPAYAYYRVRATLTGTNVRAIVTCKMSFSVQ